MRQAGTAAPHLGNQQMCLFRSVLAFSETENRRLIADNYVMSDPTTPLMQQYHAIKSRYPHALLLFRLGDFYELFYEDAMLASPELQIMLPSRNREKGQPIPMCAVPYHPPHAYPPNLIPPRSKLP